MYPGYFAQVTPDKPAAILATTREMLTYAELDEKSNRLAQYFYAQGLRRGDHVCIFMENNLKFFEVAWAAFRSGLYITTINRYLTAEEAAYIVKDSGSQAVVTSNEMKDVALDLPPFIPDCPNLLMAEGAQGEWQSYEEVLAEYPAERLEEQWMGGSMLYSSGTTGRPKGIIRPLPDMKYRDELNFEQQLTNIYGFSDESIYLSPAPLYHAAPFAFSTNMHRYGATVVVMPRFDALDSLRCIEDFKITHSQWVPTMFIRMLKLTDEERSRYDLSSHQCAIHAAAPCPVDAKKKMIDWWGPIIQEYYAGTESNGVTLINSEDWLKHPGSVGRSMTPIHICEEDGTEQPVRTPGIVYFEQERMGYAYHNAPEKTKEVQHPQYPNWSTLGDIGYLDEEGYLYLTDRRSFMIVSGGVNIYPQEIENTYVMHPKVLDVAVFGVPNEDFGEEVKAVIELVDGVEESDELTDELIDYGRESLAHYMVPRSIDYIEEMPRLPTGKLYKRLLRDRYWGKHESRII